MNQEKPKGLPIKLVLLLYFISGALALVYQVVWSRMMMHVFRGSFTKNPSQIKDSPDAVELFTGRTSLVQ